MLKYVSFQPSVGCPTRHPSVACPHEPVCTAALNPRATADVLHSFAVVISSLTTHPGPFTSVVYLGGEGVGAAVGSAVGAAVQCCVSALATPSASVGWVTVGQDGTGHVEVCLTAQRTS